MNEWDKAKLEQAERERPLAEYLNNLRKRVAKDSDVPQNEPNDDAYGRVTTLAATHQLYRKVTNVDCIVELKGVAYWGKLGDYGASPVVDDGVGARTDGDYMLVKKEW